VDEDAPATTAKVARAVQTTPATLRRWVQRGLIPQYDGEWTPTAVRARSAVARMRERGHPLEQIRDAGEAGRLAFGYLEEIFPSLERLYSLADAAEETGLEPALIERIFTMLGCPPVRRRACPRTTWSLRAARRPCSPRAFP
jgi:adenylate cyclase